MPRYGKAIAILAATAAVTEGRIKSKEDEDRRLAASTPEDLFGLLGIFPLKKKSSSKGKRALSGDQDEIASAFNNLSDEDRNRALKLAEEGNEEELFGLLGIFPLKKKASSKSSKGKRVLTTGETTPEDLFGLLGIFPLKKKASSKSSKGKRVLAGVDQEKVAAAFNNLSDEDRARALKLAEEGNEEELFGLLGIFPLKKKASSKSSKGKRVLTGESTPEDLFGLLGIFPLKKKSSSKGKRALSSVNQDEIASAFNNLNDEDRARALKLAEEGDEEELFGLLGIFPLKKKASSKSSKGKRVLTGEATPEDLFGLLGIFPLKKKSSSKGKRALSGANQDEIASAFNNLSDEDRARALKLAEEGNEEELFGLLGIFPLKKKASSKSSKGKRVLATETTPEDLFGLLGIFPLKKKASSKSSKGKRVLAGVDQEEVASAFSNLSDEDRARALKLAEEGNEEELFGLLGIFPLKKKASSKSSKGKRLLASGETTPEDLFGLLGIFPLKKKSSSKGKRALSGGNQDEIASAFNNLSDEDRTRALKLAEEGNEEELFGLLGIFPLKKKASSKSSKGKRVLTGEATPEDLFGLLGIFPLKKKSSSKGKRALSGVNEDEIASAFNNLSDEDRTRALKLAEEGNEEELFGLLGIFPLKKKASSKSSKGKRVLRAGESSPEDLFGLLGIFPLKKKASSKGKRVLAGVDQEEVASAFNSLSDEDRARALKLAEDGDEEELFGLLGIFPLKKKASSKSSKGKRVLRAGEDAPEDLFGLLGIFPLKKKASSKSSKGKRVLAGVDHDEVVNAFSNLNDDDRARALKLAEEGNEEELFGLLGIFPLKKKASSKSSKGKRLL